MRVLQFLLLSALLYSCAGGKGSETPRKKMPELSDENSLEGPPPFSRNEPGRYSDGFRTASPASEINIPSGYMYLPLPDPAGDSMSIALVQSYKASALPMLEYWAAHNHQGIAIDLASHNGAPVHRASYSFEKEGDFVIPVLLLWDDASADRVVTLKSLASELPSVNLIPSSH